MGENSTPRENEVNIPIINRIVSSFSILYTIQFFDFPAFLPSIFSVFFRNVSIIVGFITSFLQSFLYNRLKNSEIVNNFH